MKKMLSDESNQDNIVEQNSIYDFFEGYSKEEIDAVLSSLSEKELHLISLKICS